MAGEDGATTELSLLEHLDSTQLTCLNEADEHTFKSIVASKRRNTTAAYLLSDADEQLLLNIPFNQTVKIKSIALRTAPEHAAQGPKTIRLLTNKPSLTFDDVEGGGDAVLQEIELTETQVRDGARVPLRFVRFQSVTSLHIFVVSNQGGEDETRIDSIDIFGMQVMGTRDVSGLRKAEDE